MCISLSSCLATVELTFIGGLLFDDDFIKEGRLILILKRGFFLGFLTVKDGVVSFLAIGIYGVKAKLIHIAAANSMVNE